MLVETNTDTPGKVDLNPGTALERLDTWLDITVKSIPNIVMAIVVMLLFVGLALLVKRLITRTADRRQRDNLGEVLGGFAKWAILLTGSLLAATIVIPSLKPGDLIAGLGVSSVAIGFAFKDILQNWLAGLLILLRQPFEVGDQIKVEDFEGTVQRIETRATILKTYDGERVVIPNSEIYTSAVRVKTAHEKRRSQYDIGIGYGDDIDEARQVILDVLQAIPEIEKDPPPQALTWDLAASWVSIRARWWTDSKRADVVQVRSTVIQSVKEALDKAQIDMPYETRVQLVHDQTDETDGDRDKQREGWPTTGDDSPRPRWQAQRESSSSAAGSTG